MKCSLTVLALVIISLSAPSVYAQDIASEAGSPMGTGMDERLSQMQKDMNAMLKQISQLRQQSRLQKTMNVMQRQVDDLQSTTDPMKRQTLIQEHLQTMKEHMKIIRSMSEPEAATSSTIEATRSTPGSLTVPGGMMYRPGAMGIPGGMMYGPGGSGTMGGPQRYPGRMAVPGRMMNNPSANADLPWY